MHSDCISLPLFDTRRAAHERVTPTKERIYAQILAFGYDRGSRGFTADELCVAWNCPANHVAPRVCELAKARRLIATTRTRRTRSGSPARVYVLPAEMRADG